VFAGGDMVPSDRTVTIATGHGKKAARHIDAWLRGATFHKEPREPKVLFDDLHLRYYTDAQQRQQAMLPPEQRTGDFREVTAGLSEKEARFEAARCYSCGNCFECDGCFGACPEDAVIRLGRGKRYEINYDLCTGCQACVLQCPCNAMEMVPAGVST
jgi:formate dehydrogenase beta subunit